jgi:hypothetical protein
MSEMESIESRGEARNSRAETMFRLVQVLAAVGVLAGLWGAIYRPHSMSLVVAFLAFVAYLIADLLRRR